MDNTTENNKMIAAFMDGKIQGQFITWLGDRDVSCLDTDLRYHKSWDALMPVIEKIEDINQMGCQCYIDISAFNIESHSSGYLEKELNQFGYQLNGRKFTGDKKLKAVYECVTEILNWYNLKSNNQ